MELPAYRDPKPTYAWETVSRSRRARASQMRPKRSPALTPRQPAESPDLQPGNDSSAAKTFAGSEVKSGQNVPRLRGAAALCRSSVPDHDHGEAGRRPESAADLARPGRGVRLRRQLRIGEAARADADAEAPRRRCVSLPPGAEGQVDFFRGAPTLEAATGEWRRPWVFRLTLGHSRHGYEEAVWHAIRLSGRVIIRALNEIKAVYWGVVAEMRSLRSGVKLVYRIVVRPHTTPRRTTMWKWIGGIAGTVLVWWLTQGTLEFLKPKPSPPATPSSVAGSWNYSMKSDVSGNVHAGAMTLAQDGSVVSGVLEKTFDNSKSGLRGTLFDNTLELTRDTGLDTVQTYRLKKSGDDKFSGTFENIGRHPDRGSIELGRQ